MDWVVQGLGWENCWFQDAERETLRKMARAEVRKK
jgi:hypothetical protein